DAPEVMAMGAGLPIRRGGTLIGVAGVDVFLSNISQFLGGLPITQGGEIYIVDGSGQLVADTSGKLPFSILNGRGVRHRAQDASTPVIRETARALIRGEGGFKALDQPQQLTLSLSSGDALVRVDPYRDGQGLDWRIVVVIPEADVYGNLRQEAISHLVVSLVAIVISGGIALLVVEFVIRRLDRLVLSTDAMAEGELSQNVELGAIQELARLATSFNTMADRLRGSFSKLRSSNRDSLRLAQQRSDDLLALERQLAQETRLRRRLELTLQQVSTAAREPLLADPLTGLLSRRGLERRLASPPSLQVDPQGQPLPTELLLQLRVTGPAPADPTAEQLERIATALEHCCADRHGCAAHEGRGRFSLLLPGGPEQAPALLEALARELEPLQLTAGVVVLMPQADGPARLASLASADQALAEARAAGAFLRFARPAP
ncbi:MAG: HAMP domain-containing protein, partial [Cyanobium sp.]